MAIQPSNSHPPYNHSAWINSWFGKIIWNIFDFFFGWEKTIHNNLSQKTIKELSPQEIDKTIEDVFNRYSFKGTFFADSKHLKIEEEAYRAQYERYKQALPNLAKTTDVLLDNYISSQTLEGIAKQLDKDGIPAIEDDDDNIDESLIEGSTPDIGQIIQELEKDFGLTKNASRKLVTLKLAERYFQDSQQEDLTELKVARSTFNTEEGKNRVLQFLLDETKKLNELKVQELEKRIEAHLFPSDQVQPLPKKTPEKAPIPPKSKSPSFSNGASSAAEAAAVGPQPTSQKSADKRQASLQIQNLMIQLFPEHLTFSTIVSTKLIPPNITAFVVSLPNLKGEQNFTISLTAPQSGQLGVNGKSYLNPEGKWIKSAALNQLAFSTKQQISGFLNLKEQKIIFHPGDIIGSMPLIKRTLISIEYDTKNKQFLVNFAPLDNPQQLETQAWVEDDFASTFWDLKWK